MVRTRTLGRGAGRRTHHTDAATDAATTHVAAAIATTPRLLMVAIWTAAAARGRAGRESGADWLRSRAIARALPPPRRVVPLRAARCRGRTAVRSLRDPASSHADTHRPPAASRAVVNR